MTPQELRARTEAFAISVAEFAEPLFDRFITQDQARQLLRAADAMASNYRAAGRGRSHAEFTSKIGVVRLRQGFGATGAGGGRRS
jgi:hypothetical protein